MTAATTGVQRTKARNPHGSRGGCKFAFEGSGVRAAERGIEADRDHVSAQVVADDADVVVEHHDAGRIGVGADAARVDDLESPGSAQVDLYHRLCGGAH